MQRGKREIGNKKLFYLKKNFLLVWLKIVFELICPKLSLLLLKSTKAQKIGSKQEEKSKKGRLQTNNVSIWL